MQVYALLVVYYIKNIDFLDYSVSAKCFKNIKPGGDINFEDSTEIWDMFTDRNLSNVAETFLTHIVKLLNIFSHVMEDIIPTPPQVKALSNLPSASNLSPLKRRKSDLGDKAKVLSPVKSPEKDDKGEKKDVKNSLGNFVNIPHYMKIYELIKVAYNNYKVSFTNLCFFFVHCILLIILDYVRCERV